MKITCTQDEKEMAILSMATSESFCPFDKTESVVCTGGYHENCRRCIEKNVEWEIEDGEQDG